MLEPAIIPSTAKKQLVFDQSCQQLDVFQMCEPVANWVVNTQLATDESPLYKQL
jgi:hypothetical protein